MNGYMILAFASAVVAVAAVAWALWERSKGRMQAENARVQAELVSSQVSASAAGVAEAILKKNEEAIHNREQLAQARLEAQLKPVAESLQKFQEHVALVEKTRAEETGGLKEQIAALLLASTATQDEARKLSSALRRGAGVQGRWGEQTLRNVLEQAGLSSFCDFTEQASTDSEEGRRRPDVIVKLPGGGVFVIDAKCSLNAFLELQEAASDFGGEEVREAAGLRHVQSVRGHV
ncbi:MAG TPA: DNA recombination protein RmuC, partial [Phenylobacterium sp.]|nr:DNA recombination protein RmuC [Phenylobacterium sp.]